MIASYSNRKYEFSGYTNTDTFAADFIFTRRPLHDEDEALIPEGYRQRYLERVGGVAPLTHLDVIDPSMQGSVQESFNQPRIRISGSLIMDSPAYVMGMLTVGAIRVLGPITPEILEQNMADDLLRRCGKVILSEFEGIMLPRTIEVADR